MYTAISAILDFDGTTLEDRALGAAELCHGKSVADLETMFSELLVSLHDLKNKADRVDDLERQVKNLTWNLELMKRIGQARPLPLG